MKYKFYSPFIIWFAIWVFICLAMFLITLQIDKFNRESNLAKERLLCANQPAGPFSQQFGFSWEPPARPQFSWDYRPILRPQPDSPLASILGVPDSAAKGWRDFGAQPPAGHTFQDNFGPQRQLFQDWQAAAKAGNIFSTLSYLLFMVGFGAICLISAIYQNYFRRAQEEQFEAEIEVRNLRIQVLEQSRDALDLKLRLLDQDHERALMSVQEAQENIRDLEERLQSEAERNEELQAELRLALRQEKQAQILLRALEQDRRKLAAEKMDIAFLLAAAETPQEEERYRRKLKKVRGRLRLNPIWLTSLYPDLSFSPRALQNIGEIQGVTEIFPSLPDALAQINGLSLEGLLSGEKLPPKSLARFNTQELEFFQGPFWEYRFSADGRIFFGISKSRTWNIDTILLKRRFPDKKEKYDRFLATTLGKDNQDLLPELIS
ncbi:MAG: hypothetical protein ACOZF2_10355 [Thermodesulfobacteriota bacterium]